ncbi:hypothetical protein NVP1061O_13 [Vibrio phage 1.061.O._10N.286.55.C2]|nr:hypothetical protein NVP1061O_13 [Vibrio phage 1.061.O._10N.286.55.C2]
MNYSLSINGTQVSSSVQSRRDAISRDVASMIESGATTDTGSICPVKHRFAKGLYCREILIPKGVKIIGKIHATEHFNTIVQGECLVITTTEEKKIKAPYTWVTKAGEQKAVLALSDVLWQTYHVTDKTDVDEIEKDVIVDSFSQLIHDELLLGDKL